MKEYAAITVFIVLIIANARYIFQIIKRQVFPTLSTWMIFLTATSLNLISYLVATKMDFLSGILGVTDAFICLTIVVAIIIFTYSGIRLKPFEKYYLVGAGIIILFWGISRNAFAANLLVQLLILIGYFPTIQNLLSVKKNPESFSLWGLALLASIISFYPAIVGGNLLAVIYSVRSTIMISLVLCLMGRLKYKNRIFPQF